VVSQEELKSISSPKVSHFYLPDIVRHRAWVEINQGALAHNVAQVKSLLAPRTRLMAVVKADAYGHGAVNVAETVLQSGASHLAIATLAEGIELREAGIQAPILVLGAINTPEEIAALCHWQLQPTICNLEQAQVVAQTLAAREENLCVHLKLDTGMSRLGTLWDQAPTFAWGVQKLPRLNIASVYSHLATADAPDVKFMECQQERFASAISQIKSLGISIPYLHLANSAATLANSATHYDLVRVGLALYGLYPASHLSSVINLKPVLSVKAKITQVKTIPADSGVSYGHQYISNKEIKIAIVSIGYADGVPRNLSNKLKVLIQGKLASQIGALTMDQMMIDVSDFPDIFPGEIVTLIGRDGDYKITPDDWARQLKTISWEIICGFKHRLPRVNILN
jgi:alanine racemase